MYIFYMLVYKIHIIWIVVIFFSVKNHTQNISLWWIMPPFGGINENPIICSVLCHCEFNFIWIFILKCRQFAWGFIYWFYKLCFFCIRMIATKKSLVIIEFGKSIKNVWRKMLKKAHLYSHWIELNEHRMSINLTLGQ